MTSNLTFAAFDVETANRNRGSICSIGVAIVRNGVRVRTHSWLCRPPAGIDGFDAWNMKIHKITPDMVAGQPTFAQRWPEVLDTVAGLPVVAHNASFDITAVSQACAHSRTTMPTWRYGCTLEWSKHHLPLPRYGLKYVAAALGVTLNRHHDAGADADAAADIAVRLATRTGAHDLDALAAASGTRLLSLSPVGSMGR